ncbi:unnamed protein product [Acanthoscelides obtectus]|nr:unnamed protein product [Acanthoscelides obtectus]CAK1625749.1 hypothetical protein AOBTE_LOCUS3370 [Acanthoscelides obtectus]
MLESELQKEKTVPTLSKVFCKGLEIDDRFVHGIRKSRRNKKKLRKSKEKKCFRCNQPLTTHENITCPFDWAQCESCEMPGHLLTACKYQKTKCNKCRVIGHVAKICKGQKGIKVFPGQNDDPASASETEHSVRINDLSDIERLTRLILD